MDIRNKHIFWHLIKGHANINDNEAVETLASNAAQESRIWLQKQSKSRQKRFSLQHRPTLPHFPTMW